MKIFISDISGKSFPLAERVSGSSICESILKIIQKDYPTISENSSVSVEELNFYREKYIEELVTKEVGEITELEDKVLNALSERNTISDKLDDDAKPGSLGQRMADKVASFGGSWTFIIAFLLFMLAWVAANVVFLANNGFDPYPFILLNLILSCIAAIQAPIIMMSQNRQEEKDRERARNDYMINLKSELEIRMLNEKIDHLIIHQQQELLETQKLQAEIMNDILREIETNKKK
ncbi:MAG: DUF1003 domain-containing protein [Mangrovibacterium sp.]